MKKQRTTRPMQLWMVMVISLTMTAILALLISTLLIYARFYSAIRTSAMINTEQAVKNISTSLNTFVDSMSETMNNIEKAVSKNDKVAAVERDLAVVFEMRSDLVNIAIYDSNGVILTLIADEDSVLKPNYIETNLSFDKTINLQQSTIISQPHVNNLFNKKYPWVVTMTRPYHSEVYGTVYLSMDMVFEGIAKYLDNTSIGEHGYAYVVNNAGKIVYHPQQQLIYSGLKQESAEIIKELERSSTVYNTNNIFARESLDNIDWNIVGVSYIDDLVNVRRDEFLIYCAIIGVFGLAVAFVLSIVLSKGMTKPINDLIQSMQEFERDAESYRVGEINGFQEIDQLSQSFNHMSERIQHLMERIKLEEKELRKVELKALQAQINPHFLYNTLDSILWMCKQNENDAAALMVSSLAKLFRISISRGADLITVKEELQHVESYLVIQNIRYKNQFSYNFDIDESILKYKCVKIMLQPFVENAIYHGIDRMVDEGSITISGRRVGDNVVFKVIDNGLGMTEEQMSSLFEEIDEKSGVGVKNVHNRLQIYFGKDYGITMKSQLDVGTEITITIPVITDTFGGTGNAK